MEKYSNHLESIVKERTADLEQEKLKTDRLLYSMYTFEYIITLQWRHNERDGVSNCRRLDGLFKENIKALRHWPL